MRTITTSTITATLFDADPYIFERNVIKFKTTRNVMFLRSGSSIIVFYDYVAGKEILIDLTEYVIANPNPTSEITLHDGSTTATITWQSSGKLFNPNKIQRPSYPLAQFFTKNNAMVYFPNIIFAPSSVFSGDHFLTWSPEENLDFSLASSGGNTIDRNIYIVETLEEDNSISIGSIDSKAQYKKTASNILILSGNVYFKKMHTKNTNSNSTSSPKVWTYRKNYIITRMAGLR